MECHGLCDGRPKLGISRPRVFCSGLAFSDSVQVIAQSAGGGVLEGLAAQHLRAWVRTRAERIRELQIKKQKEKARSQWREHRRAAEM
jgi:hypothetical protein